MKTINRFVILLTFMFCFNSFGEDNSSGKPCAEQEASSLKVISDQVIKTMCVFSSTDVHGHKRPECSNAKNVAPPLSTIGIRG